ncbi:viral A-type inclusion protein [Tritrichomonas foetus]|uniref:Viral A-type inclusion protein n=1 Tax=Tritrichomonas foetus TaxID=1144522 RepID=A0A1J4K378_9EUKA|nr:viral A-type inclusion protein [Tritrichomonas foetus]|eukprot:OHT05426.1 viral A-type inclusion protein [Tritrichomonas foetus]
MASSDSQLLGEEILSKFINQSQEDIVNDNSCLSKDDPVYIKCVELSNFLDSLGDPPLSLSEDNFNAIQLYIDDLVNLLSSVGKPITSKIGPGSSSHEAFKLISFALLLIRNESKNSENMKVLNIQNKYHELLENSSQEICEIDQLKIQNQKLVEENAQLSVELEKTNKYKKYKKFGNILNDLCERLNIPEDSDLDEILTKLLSLNTFVSQEKSENNDQNNDQEIETISNTREAQKMKIQLMQKEINALKLVNHEENINAKIYLLETDINSLNLQNQALSDELSKQKEKNRTLSQELLNSSNDIKSKMIALESLQMQMNQITIERDELKNTLDVQKTLLNDPSLLTKDDQINGMNKIFQELSKQIENMTEELTDLSQSRNNLLSIVQKQNEAIDLYDMKLNALNDKKANHSQKTKKESEIFYVLNDINNLTENDEIKEILFDKSKDERIRIFDAFSYLLNQIHTLGKTKDEMKEKIISDSQNAEIKEYDDKVNELKKENERLCKYLITNLCFLDKITNSSEIQDWLITGQNTNEIREALIAQCKRVESFIKQRSIECDDLVFSDIPKFISQNLDEIADKSELVISLQQSSLINDVLRKYLLKVEEQMETLTEEARMMKYELSHTESSIEDSTLSLRDELDLEKLNNQKLEEEIRTIRDKLKGELSHIEKAKIVYKAGKALKIKNKHSNEYVILLEAKVQEEKKKNDEITKEITRITDEAKNAMHVLKKQIISLQEKINEEDKKSADLRHQYEISQKSLNEEKEKSKHIIEDNAKLNSTISELSNVIKGFNDSKQKEIEAITDELAAAANEKMEILKDEIRTKNSRLQILEEEYKTKMKEMKKEHKLLTFQLQNELEAQTKRATEIRNHFEPILEESRKKLNECREKYNSNLEKIQIYENEIKQLKTDLASSRIETKMNLMKLTANEEKMKRDKSLFETQLKMKIMSLETYYNALIEKTKTQHDNKLHDFLVKISGEFKEFVDFNEPITFESTTAMLQSARKMLDLSNAKVSGLEKYLEEIGDIKTVLEVSRDSEVIPAITTLVKKVNDISKNKHENNINKNQTLPKEAVKINEEIKKWEKWAKRLHSIITDEFSAQKSPKELQFVIEEALMSSIGQRQIWRHVEILRSEKHILEKLNLNSIQLKVNKSGNNLNKINRELEIKQPDMLTLSLCFTAIYRLQKLSGHLHGAITFNNEPPNNYINNPKPSPKPKHDKLNEESPKKYPILIFS